MGYDANQHLRNFHRARVYADPELLALAERRRSANRDRLRKGLTDDGDPQPVEFVEQGSYAMKTMVRSENEASDIDDGVVFKRDDLKGERGADKTPRDTKEMVCRAITKNGKFKTEPDVRKNCVRVYYDDGFHVDIPVYRTWEEDGNTRKQLAASSDWRDSAPEDITEWFVRQVAEKSPETVGSRQMRRIVRLLKYWAKSRASWVMPSGFVLSVLVDENFRWQGWNGRDDQALLAVMRAIRNNRQWGNNNVYRPVPPRDEITNERTRAHVDNLCEQLKGAIEELSKLEAADCDELTALKALKWVFCTDYWDDRIKELEEGDDGGGGGNGSGGGSGGGGTRATVPPEPKRPIDKKGGTGNYA